MKTTIQIKKDSAMDALARKLLDAASCYLEEAQKHLGQHSVVWLMDDDGKMLLFTRGEYKNAIMSAVEDCGGMEGEFYDFSEVAR